MQTSIKAVNKASSDAAIAILCDKKASYSKLALSKSELDLAKSLEKNENDILHVNPLTNKFVILLDKGKESYESMEACRVLGDRLAKIVNRHKKKTVAIINQSTLEQAEVAIAEGLTLGNYQFLKYKSKKDTNTLKTVQVVGSKHKKALSHLEIVCEATCHARDLVNEPLSYLTAEQLSKDIQKIGKQAGFKTTVFNKKKIQSLKMGGLLAVNQGSLNPPTFNIMEWKPKNAKNKKPIILVGKGVVYDTGGLSLKPTSNSMDMMKCDMAGSAAVVGAIAAIAKAKLPVHIISIVPATENRPSLNAYAPGDVITMYSGKTVEVLNTDAEGRLVLADGLSYAKKYKPELVMDIATLTGASARAIGQYGTVYMGTADKKYKDALEKSGQEVHERLIEFPFWEDYGKLLKSDIADLKNVAGAVGGSITAGKFLEEFTDYPWLHFDIAGPAFISHRDSYRGKWATGVGVRLFFNYILNRA